MTGCVLAPGCHDLVNGDLRVRPYLWRTAVGDGESIWHGTPGTDESSVYVQAGQAIVALDASSGAVRWRRSMVVNEIFDAQNIVVRDGRVFVAEIGGVYALDARTGDSLWCVVPDSNATGSENLVDDRALYVGTRSHEVLALAQSDGHTIWSVDIGPDWQWLGAVQGISRVGDTLYVSAGRWLDQIGLGRRGVVLALDRRDGHEIWRFETVEDHSGFDAAPRVAEDLLLLGDRDGEAFLALDRATGRQRWRTPTEPHWVGPRASPVERNGIIYGAGNDGYAYALRHADGARLWRSYMGASNSDLALCGRVALVESQAVVYVNPADGRVLATLFGEDPDDFTTSGIAIAGGRAFVTGPRAVYALRC